MFPDQPAMSGNPQDSERTPLVSKHNMEFNRVWIRVLTCVASLAEGYDIAVFSGAINRVESEMKLGTWEIGVLMASTGIGMMLGVFTGPLLSDKIGRRLALLIAYVTLVAATTYTALANGFVNLFISRLICGCGCFAGAATTAMYIAEVSPSHVRGFYASMEDLFINIGILLAYTVNLVVLGRSEHDWRITVAIGAAPPLIALLMSLYFLPESPRYLYKHGHVLEGRHALENFVELEEVDDILESWNREIEQRREDDSLLSSAARRKAVLLGIGVGSMAAFSGMPFLLHLQGWELKHSGFTEHQAATSQWATSVTKTVVLFVSIPFMDQLGRRTLLLGSTFVMTLANAFVGYVFLTGTPDLTMVILAISLSLAGYSAGLGPVHFAYIPEIFDTHVRAKGIAMSFVLSRVWAGAFLALGPTIISRVGVAPVMFTCSALSAVNFLFTYFVLPETRGMKLEDMDAVLGSKETGLDAGTHFAAEGGF